MTELLNAEYEDTDGERKTLTREEVLGYIGLLSGAGNETTDASHRLDGQAPRRAPRPA